MTGEDAPKERITFEFPTPVNMALTTRMQLVQVMVGLPVLDRASQPPRAIGMFTGSEGLKLTAKVDNAAEAIVLRRTWPRLQVNILGEPR